MKSVWLPRLAHVVTTLWVGSLWAIGYLAVPVLFGSLDDRMLAGKLAGTMFSLTAYLGMASAIFLLIYQSAGMGWREALRDTAFLVVCAMLVLTLTGEFILQPQMAALKAQVQPADIMHTPFAARFGMLHGIAELLYLAQSLLGILLVVKKK